MNISSLLVQQGLIISVGLYIVGVFCKKATFIPDKFIPLILGVLGVVAAGFSMEGGWTITNIIQGLMAAALAVYGNQVYIQSDKPMEPLTPTTNADEQPVDKNVDGDA